MWMLAVKADWRDPDCKMSVHSQSLDAGKLGARAYPRIDNHYAFKRSGRDKYEMDSRTASTQKPDDRNGEAPNPTQTFPNGRGLNRYGKITGIPTNRMIAQRHSRTSRPACLKRHYQNLSPTPTQRAIFEHSGRRIAPST